MFIRDIFETRIEEKIEPVIKVGERLDEKKLAGEIGSYVVTPTIEKYLDDFLEHFTDSFQLPTTEIGGWISGYFGSGKSHLAKMAALLVENRTLDGIPAVKRFESRIPADAPHRSSITRSMSRLGNCNSQIIAFNLNTIADSKSTPLPRLLLSQYYQSKGYGSNFIYARVIEAELDKRGKLEELHSVAERLSKKSWRDMMGNMSFYSRALFQAVCEVAPEIFSKPEDVAQALKSAENGELYNVQFLVQTILEDLDERQKKSGKPCRLVLVLDESGQWIEDDGGRLAQLQALVEEAAIKGQGKMWVFVTTHEDMGSIFQNARALKGDMKKIEPRFRHKLNLTTENIELVLEDRIFRKNISGKSQVISAYKANPGVLRDLGQLNNTDQKLPECSEERFSKFYPFFPYQIHLIPEIVKSLRSSGGRGDQLSGSTRTLLAITQDILRQGRRKYLEAAVGDIVSFDELYHNLSGEGEVNPDARRELSRIEEVVKDSTPLTRRVAEVLYLIREISYVPRTIDNLARLLVEHTTDDLTTTINKIKPELLKLMAAKIVAPIGEEYEFLTGERRTFEEAVATAASDIKWKDLEKGFSDYFTTADVVGFEKIPYKGTEFSAKISLDAKAITKDGYTDICISSPLAALGGVKVSDIEDRSLRSEEQQSVFVWSPSVHGFDNDLRRYLAMRQVVDAWKGDPHLTEDSRKLASERESIDLKKLRDKVVDGIKDGLKNAHVVFRGSGRTVSPKPGTPPGELLRNEIACFWATLYTKYDKVPVRITNEQKGIIDVLTGGKSLGEDVKKLKIFDASGQLDPQSPLIDAIRIYLSTRQSKNERTLGKDITLEFEKPPYGWDPCAVRIGIAALVRAGAVRVLINKKPFTNSGDPELQNALRVSREFDKVELVMEETELESDVLTEVRALLIKLTGRKKIDETPATLSQEMESFGTKLIEQASAVSLWASPAGISLSDTFSEGKESFESLLALSNPIHRVKEIHTLKDKLEGYATEVATYSGFVDKWGKAFTGMRTFVTTIRAISFKLPVGGVCTTFLGNWDTAQKEATVVQKDVWKDLQNSQAGANLELEQKLAEWKTAARQLLENALGRLPQDLTDNDLPVELLEGLSNPLKTCLTSIDAICDPLHIAQLPDQATYLIQQLAAAIEEEKRKRRPPPPPPKQFRRIRINDVLKNGRITTLDQWEQARGVLDSEISQALAEGKEVEIS